MAKNFPKRKFVSRVPSVTSEKSTELIRLNVHEQVKSITDIELIHSSETSKVKLQKAWPYIFKSPSKPKRYKPKNKLPEKSFQTEQKFHPKIHKVKKSSTKSSTVNFLWKPPEEIVSEAARSSASIQSSASSKTMINMDVLCKQIESKSRFLEKNTLPKYVFRKSLISIPNWVKRNLPGNINPRTIIQAGKPWHKSNECTWAIEAKNITPFHTVTYFIDKNSPKIDWGTSASSFQRKKFDTEYQKAKIKKKTTVKSVSIHRSKMSDRNKSCKAHYYQNILKKKVLDPIIFTLDPPSSQRTLSPYESMEDIVPSYLEHGLDTLSYTKKHDQKTKFSQPNIYGIEKPWECLTERKWPSNIATTTLLNSLVKSPPDIPTIDLTKYPVYGQWPYVENMVKTMDFTTGTFKTRTEYSLDSNYRKSFSNRNLEYTGKNKKKKSSSIILPMINPIRKQEEYFNYKQNQLTEVEQGTETIPSTLNQQKLFPGFIEIQASSIKPLLTYAPFKYQLSNLHLYESNYTYLMQKDTYLRTLIYYSTFNNKVTHDPFQVITTKRYLNKIPYLYVPSSGPATIYYPSGKIAIQCTYSCIESQPDLLTRRYTIRNELTQRIEAIFDSLGNGIVYDKRGNSIFNYSQNFGVRIQNNRVYKWRWHNIPVTDEIFTEETDSLRNPQNIPNNEIEEMLLRNVNIYDQSYNSIEEKKSVDKSLDSNHSFPEQNPLAYKPNGDINYGIVTQLKPFTVKINEYLKVYVKDQKHMVLEFQANEIHLTIQLGVLLNPRIILGRESVNYHLIPYEKIVCKFDKMVGEKSSLIKILNHVGDGKKLHPLKHKTQLIDFNDKNINLIENEIIGDTFKNSSLIGDIQARILSDQTLRVKNTKIKCKKKVPIQIKKTITQTLNKSIDEDHILTECEEEKLSEIGISHLDNLLEGSNVVVSNVSLLLNNKTKLKQFLYETKCRSRANTSI